MALGTDQCTVCIFYSVAEVQKEVDVIESFWLFESWK